MLFCGEAQLTGTVAGTSDFAHSFAKRGPLDAQGRSLRQFNLRTRLFKFPCSYLIYSAPFDGLPPAAREEVYRQLHDILTGNDTDPDFAHLTSSDRHTILEILRETKHNLPDAWN